MKTSRTLRMLGIAAAAGLLTACPGDRAETDPAADVPVTEVGPGLEPATVRELPVPERVAIEGAGIATEAVLSPMEGSTHVVLEVRQGPANGSVQAAIHDGDCEEPGQQVASLGTAATDAAGTGRSETHLGIPAHELFDGLHHIRVTSGAEAVEGAMACADIPARAIPRLEADPAEPAGAPGAR